MVVYWYIVYCSILVRLVRDTLVTECFFLILNISLKYDAFRRSFFILCALAKVVVTCAFHTSGRKVTVFFCVRKALTICAL